MKNRSGFVSNSSSSSFILVMAGRREIISAGDDINDVTYETFQFNVDIDEVIESLQKAKAEGCKEINVAYGGGYQG